MTDQTTVICENCQTPFSAELTHCPTCDAPHPAPAHLPDDDALEELLRPRRPWWRSRLGCSSLILMILLILGGIGLGAYDGLKERSVRRQAQIDQLFEQSLQYADNNQIELAIAGLNQILTLDPAHTQAREMLAQLKVEPTITPPPVSASRQNVAADLFEQAKTLTLQGDWRQAIELYHQLRDVDPTFQPGEVSAALYTANFELGLRFEADGDLQSALYAFDAALEERPNDPAVTNEWEKVSLYLSLDTADPTDFENTLVVLNRLYTIDPNFADVPERLFNTYRNYGDALAAQGEWCLAKARYASAQALRDSQDLQTLVSDAAFRCRTSTQAKLATATPVATATLTTAITGTEALTAPVGATTIITNAGTGILYFGRFSTAGSQWEIIRHDLSTGVETVALTGGLQPSVRNGILLYHSLASNSEGLHNFNLNTGEDIRVSTFAEDELPRWGASDAEFVFASRREGDRRWRIYTTFADGKSEAQMRSVGRTPALSPTDNAIFYQGTDPQGNNPGIYRLPFAGGEAVRLTDDDSDRSPAIAADGTVAFMTTRRGNWDIFVWDTATNSAIPLVATPANEGLPQWSADGTQLAFVSDAGGSWGVYLLDFSAEDPSPQKVADWGREHPDWLQQQLSWGN